MKLLDSHYEQKMKEIKKENKIKIIMKKNLNKLNY